MKCGVIRKFLQNKAPCIIIFITSQYNIVYVALEMEDKYVKGKGSITTILINLAILTFTSVLLVCTVSSIGSHYNKHQINCLGGIGFVIADSSEDTFGISMGDITIVRLTGSQELKKGDVAVYKDEYGRLAFAGAVGFKNGSMDVQTGQNTYDNIKLGSIAGKYVFSIPLLGYVINFAEKGIGTVVCIVIPLVLIFAYILALVADGIIDGSRQRKKIIRKRNRRRQRYKEDGLFSTRKAVL